MTIKHIEFPSKSDLHNAFKKELLDEFSQDLGNSPSMTILPGGSTPLAVYSDISQTGGNSSSSRILVLSDERMVPTDHVDSNYRSILPMAKSCGIAEHNIVSPLPHLPIAEAAAELDHRLTEIIVKGAGVDTCYLGLGTDGHTASLFPGMTIPGPQEQQLAIPAPKENGPSRISITPRLIQMADKIVFLVCGKEKTAMTHRLLTEPLTIPAGVVVDGHPNTEIWSYLS